MDKEIKCKGWTYLEAEVVASYATGEGLSQQLSSSGVNNGIVLQGGMGKGRVSGCLNIM